MSTTTQPDGSVLTSTALTPDALMTLLQPLVCNMLAINPPDYSRVRIDWPTTGQPAWGINDDICFVRATESDDLYNRIRDYTISQKDIQSVTQKITYTRVWRVNFTLYGPNSFDNTRIIRDSLFFDWTHDTLATSGMYLISDVPATTYAPELFQAQWWKRTDLTVCLNEFVTDTITTPTMAYVEILIENERGQAADITVTH